jgi:hypothetical protein
MSHPLVRTDLACRNCGAQAPSKFCPDCGQETTLHPPTLAEFLHEFVGHYVALEGTLWRTLWLLLCRPGRLTREYLDGRRRRYVLPLRLYLTASFVFFLVLKLFAGNFQPGTDVRADGQKVPLAEFRAEIASAAAGARAEAASGVASGAAPKFEVVQDNECGRPGQRACNRLEAALNESLLRLQEHPQEALEHTRDHALHWAPYAIFVMLPGFAAIMLLAYRNRRMTYGEHFVFSLHLHAFWFLAGLLLIVVPDAISGLLQLAVMLYGGWAMHETYGGRWWTTVLRALFVIVLYSTLLAVVMTVLAIALLAAS